MLQVSAEQSERAFISPICEHIIELEQKSFLAKAKCQGAIFLLEVFKCGTHDKWITSPFPNMA